MANRAAYAHNPLRWETGRDFANWGYVSAVGVAMLASTVLSR